MLKLHRNKWQKKKKKKNIKKNYAITEIRTQDASVQSPPIFPLRYGGQRN